MKIMKNLRDTIERDKLKFTSIVRVSTKCSVYKEKRIRRKKSFFYILLIIKVWYKSELTGWDDT